MSWKIGSLSEGSVPVISLSMIYACYVASVVTQFFVLIASDQYEPETRLWLLFQISEWAKAS
jgi:hypothetical protein